MIIVGMDILTVSRWQKSQNVSSRIYLQTCFGTKQIILRRATPSMTKQAACGKCSRNVAAFRLMFAPYGTNQRLGFWWSVVTRRRNWQEQSFRDLKSGGWNWSRTSNVGQRKTRSSMIYLDTEYGMSGC